MTWRSTRWAPGPIQLAKVDVSVSVIKWWKIGLAVLFVTSMLVSMVVTPEEGPYLPLLTFPLSYLALAYWLGTDSIGGDFELMRRGMDLNERENARHRAGQSYLPHGLALGLIVASTVVLIRHIGIYPLPQRVISVVVAAVGGCAVYVYARYVVKERTGGLLVGIVLLGGLPIWSQFGVGDP